MAAYAVTGFAMVVVRNQPHDGRGARPGTGQRGTPRSFERDFPDAEVQLPSTPPLRRQAALILAGMGARLALGVATALFWLL